MAAQPWHLLWPVIISELTIWPAKIASEFCLSEDLHPPSFSFPLSTFTGVNSYLNLKTLCLSLLSEPLLQGSSWDSGHISAHSCLGSLSSAQWTLKKERDQEVSAGLMVPQNLVHLPNPSIIIDLSGSHAPASGPVSMIHNLIAWERHRVS